MNPDYWNGDAGAAWAANADRMDPLIAPFGLAAMDALAPRPGERILDVGCGAGDTSRELARRVGPTGAVLGVDVSGPLLELARARGGGPEYLLADAGTSPLPTGFDALFSRFGVMFFDEPAAAFTNLRRALRPGGRLAFVCWRSAGENAWAREAAEATLPLLREPPPAPPPDAPGPFAFHDAERLRGILRDAGFSDVSVRPFDTGYRMGATPEAAADLSMTIGPVARLVREQALDPAPFRAALEALMHRHVGEHGVVMPAACWIVTAVTGG